MNVCRAFVRVMDVMKDCIVCIDFQVRVNSRVKYIEDPAMHHVTFPRDLLCFVGGVLSQILVIENALRFCMPYQTVIKAS